MRCLLGDFSPDLDSVMQGMDGRKIAPAVQSVLTDCNWIFSTPAGWRNLPTPKPQGNPLPSRAYGAFSALVGTQPVVVLGTANQLYLYQSGQMVSQWLTLNNSANQWYFTVYGLDLLATNGIDPVQVSTDGSAFAALGGMPPVFSIIEATDFALWGIIPNSSQFYFTLNDVLWTPNVATQTATGVLASTSGNITAARALRSGINLFKRNSFFNASFTGPPFFYQITKVSDRIGTTGPRAVIAHDTLQSFWGPDDFYQTDGTSLWRIPNNLRRWFLANLNPGFDFQIYGVYDLVRSQLVWWFSSNNASPAGAYDSYVSYSLLTGKWAHGNLNIDLPVSGLVGANQPFTWATFENSYQKWANIPSVVWGSPIFSGSQTINGTAIIDTNHYLNLLSGTWSATLPAFVETGDFGDKRSVYRITGARPNFAQYPVAPPLANAAKLDVYSTYIQGQPYNLRKGQVALSPYGSFDFVTSDRLQRLRVNFYSDGELIDLDVNVAYAGNQ